MTEKAIKRRTKANAIYNAQLCSLLPYSAVNKVYLIQLFRSSLSVAVNYRNACKSKSKKDFICKLPIVEEEGTKQWFYRATH